MATRNAHPPPNPSLGAEAVDKYGNNVDEGGASIAVRALGTGVSPCTVEDNNDGTYGIKFTSTVAGEGRVVVRLENTEMAPVVVQFINPPGGSTASLEGTIADDESASTSGSPLGRRNSVDSTEGTSGKVRRNSIASPTSQPVEVGTPAVAELEIS